MGLQSPAELISREGCSWGDLSGNWKLGDGETRRDFVSSFAQQFQLDHIPSVTPASTSVSCLLQCLLGDLPLYFLNLTSSPPL